MHRRSETKCIAVLLFLLALIARGDGEDRILEWIEPTSCRHNKSEYFHADTFECKSCPHDLVRSDSGFECVCDRNSTTVAIRDGNPVCAPCETGKVRTTDGHDCISCKDRGKACACSDNEITIERSWNGTLLDTRQCLPCPRSTYLSTDGTRCLPCFEVWSRDDRDDWPLEDPVHEALCKYCTPRDSPKDWPDLQSTYIIEFKNKKITVDSYFFRRELRFTFHSCEHGVSKACSQLANMCSLTLFSTSSIACELFERKNEPNAMNPSSLLYRQGEARAVSNRRSIGQRYSLDRADRVNNSLKVVVARFGLRGRFDGISEPNLPCPFFDNLPFGVNLSKRCKISATELTNARMEFLVPYLSHPREVNSEKRILHPLPVFVKNINEHVDQDDLSRRRLVGRFFGVDKITGYKAISNSKNGSFRKAPELEVLRYVKSLSLVIKLQERSERGKIFPPLLVVEYDELTSREILENVEVTMDCRVTYSLTDDATNAAIEISIGVFTGLAVVFSALQAWSYSRRSCKNVASVATISWFVVHCLGSVANVLLVICTCSCAFTFVFYKGQKVVHILLPDSHNEWTIGVCTVVGFAFKTVEISGLMYQQRSTDVFFIDWEQPRTMGDRASTTDKLDTSRLLLGKHAKSAAKVSSCPSIGDEGKTATASEIIGARRKRSTSPARSASRASTSSSREFAVNELDHRVSVIAQPPATVYPLPEADLSIGEPNKTGESNSCVSIWRTCVVANEWLRLKTVRKINILLQILTTFFILEIAGGKYWAKAIPELSREPDETLWIDESFTLKYAVGILVYLVVYTVQWWFSVFIWQRYVKNQLQEFIDLCSIANISVFLLAHDYYGYYIHGRSVHGFADADLLTLIKDLQREEQNLCAHRGLIPGTTEQTFVVSMSKTFRAFYDGLVSSEYSRNGKFLRRNLSNVPTDWEERWRTHLRLREFFTRFLDHCYKNVDYTVKERHCLEKMCDFEVTEIDERSIFYIDNDYSFDRAIFHGNEWSLATFEINAFLLVLVFGCNYTLASIAVLLVAKVVSAIAKVNAKRLLARKTFIDERFLVSQSEENAHAAVGRFEALRCTAAQREEKETRSR